MGNCGQACPYNTIGGCKVKEYNAICPLYNMATPITEYKMTHADRIRAMSDEELAELFGAILREREIILLQQMRKQGVEASIMEMPKLTFNAHLEWLKQSAE